MDQLVSLCPLAGTDLFQLQAPVSADGDVDLSVDGLNTFIERRTGQTGIRVEAVHWASAYSMNARLAARYRVQRIFLAGDAAHIHPPTGGQGLNTSVQDAYNLGWKLAAVLSGSAGRLLDSYEDERRPIAAEMLGLSEKLLDSARKGDMRRGRETQQLDLRYFKSSLVQPDSSPSRIASGERAPDALLTGAGGQVTRLFDLFKGPHWTLLGYEVKRDVMPSYAGVQAHTIGQEGDLLDPGRNMATTYGIHQGDLVLIRPDGYVAATASIQNAECIIEYLLSVER